MAAVVTAAAAGPAPVMADRWAAGSRSISCIFTAIVGWTQQWAERVQQHSSSMLRHSTADATAARTRVTAVPP